jgi:DNA primase
MSIPDSFNGSQAFQFITSRGWNWRNASAPNIELEKCPYCGKDNYHLRMEIHGSTDEQKNRDGLHICMKCGQSGSLRSLKEKLGVTIPGVESRKDYSSGERKIEPLPDIEACHEALLEDEAALDYLMNGRGFSLDIIKQQKIGVVPKRYFRECGEVKALVYPYLVNGNCVFVHYRTLPTMPLSENKVPKAFSSPTGWDVPLYNGEILRDGLKEVVMVEGEPDAIAAMDHGVTDICGVPGANFKKAEWIETLDSIGIEKVYLCYDKDKVGQKAAQALAARIGVEKCWKLTLPDFDVVTEDGEARKGKDLNEWFTQGGGTAEEFQTLKENAELFDVDGVASSKDAVQEFLDELLGKGTAEPRYKTQWPEVNKFVGFDEGDVIDILAPEKVGKTTWAMNLVEHMVDTYGEDGVIICLEMTKAKMARKWISHMAQIADNIPKTPEEAKQLFDQFTEAIPKLQALANDRDGELYFCYPKYKTTEDIYKLIRDIIRRYGVKWIVFDNVQRLADTTNDNGQRTQHLSQISKVLSQIAKDYGVQMVRILQPHRIGGGRAITTDNVDGASQIAKDCDVMMTAQRTRLGGEQTTDQLEAGCPISEEGSFGTRFFVGIGLSRYSPGGRVELHYDGATSTVKNIDEAILAKIELETKKPEKQNSNDAIAALKQAVAPQTEAKASEGEEINV